MLGYRTLTDVVLHYDLVYEYLDLYPEELSIKPFNYNPNNTPYKSKVRKSPCKIMQSKIKTNRGRWHDTKHDFYYYIRR